MKKFTILLLTISIVHFSFGQQTATNTPAVNTDYLKKSKNQKKIAWILLGTGATSYITGAAIDRGQVTHEDPWGNKTYENDGIKGGFKTVGWLCGLSSIPFFLASSKNKKKGIRLSFSPQNIQQLMPNGNYALKSVQSLNLKVNL